jgi:hypothetical protein
MDPITFFRDLARFRQEGLLSAVGYLLLARGELLFFYGLLIGLFVYFRADPRTLGILGIVTVLLTLILFVKFEVELLTPVFFGPFAIGRLSSMVWSRGGETFGFELVPSGDEVDTNAMAIAGARGTVGRTYLLLQHPDDASIVLPLFDDDPRCMAYILRFAFGERRDLIVRQIEFFRNANS